MIFSGAPRPSRSFQRPAGYSVAPWRVPSSHSRAAPMKLNHLNLAVTDVRAASEFLEKYLGMRRVGGNAGMAFLTDEPDGGGFVLTLMKAREVDYPGNFHVGFFVESAENVDDINRRLREDGFEAPLPEDTGHSYGFYMKAPGGFTVEIGA